MIIIEEYPPFAVDTRGYVYNSVTGKLIKPHKDSYGYYRVSTTCRGKKVNGSVHRLLATAFIPNPDKLPQVNHKDGVKTNNNLSNLEWCSNQQNSDHANGSGLRDSMLGEGSHFNIHPEDLIKSICILLEEGWRNIDIARKLSINTTLVSDVRGGRTWKHISKNYRIVSNKRVSYSEDKIRFICRLIQDNTPYKVISEKTGVPVHTIRDIKGKKVFKHITDGYF